MRGLLPQLVFSIVSCFLSPIKRTSNAKPLFFKVQHISSKRFFYIRRNNILNFYLFTGKKLYLCNEVLAKCWASYLDPTKP